MVRRSSAALCAALLAGAVAPVAAEPLVDPKNHYRLDLGDDWAVERSGEPPQLLSLRHRSGARAVLTRTNFPNRPAWRRRAHYFDDVVAGIKANTAGFALHRRKRGRLKKIPYLDVVYRREHDSRPLVHTRFLFYRTFTLILTASSSPAGRRSAARLVRSLGPPKR
jgi:hypothetical protein